MTPATTRKARRRLDLELVARGLAPSRERAQALILAGAVRVDGHVERSAAAVVPEGASVDAQVGASYVGRGAEKLAGALDVFGVDPAGRVCADVGASTGGFTEVLLRRGALRVYAIDVGRGQLAWKLRQDPRVVVMEGVNVRELGALPEPLDLAAADVSFISLRLALPPIVRFLREGAAIIALVKPQFEVGQKRVGRGGVVREPEARAAAVRDVVEALATQGLGIRGVARSALRGREGNVEVFCHFVKGPPDPAFDLALHVAEAARWPSPG